MSQSTALHPLFASWGADFFEDQGLEIPLRLAGAAEEYRAATENCVIADGGDRALILVEGDGVADWLQRFLTSDACALQPGYGQWSAMLDAKGKWIADLLLYRAPGESADQWLIDCPSCRAQIVLERLELMHFGEDCRWRLLELARLMVAGPAAQAKVHALGSTPPVGDAPPPQQELAIDRWPGGHDEPETGWILQRPDRGLPCWEWIGSPHSVTDWANALRDGGATPCGWVVLDILRVEAGIPRWGSELNAEVSLPQSNEWRRGSLSKGCYAGQEVLARIHAYGEAPRQLCRLRFDQGEIPLHGAEILDGEGKHLGKVHSWVYSPRRGEAIGLATVRRRAAVDGTKVTVVQGTEKVMATVAVPDKVLG